MNHSEFFLERIQKLKDSNSEFMHILAKIYLISKRNFIDKLIWALYYILIIGIVALTCLYVFLGVDSVWVFFTPYVIFMLIILSLSAISYSSHRSVTFARLKLVKSVHKLLFTMNKNLDSYTVLPGKISDEGKENLEVVGDFLNMHAVSYLNSMKFLVIGAGLSDKEKRILSKTWK
jgi:hypothetical protein